MAAFKKEQGPRSPERKHHVNGAASLAEALTNNSKHIVSNIGQHNPAAAAEAGRAVRGGRQGGGGAGRRLSRQQGQMLATHEEKNKGSNALGQRAFAWFRPSTAVFKTLGMLLGGSWLVGLST